MGAEAAFAAALASAAGASLTGLALSVVIEQLAQPRLAFKRPWPAWALHGGLWLLAHALLTLLLGRPWFAAALVLAFLLMVVLVGNAKFKSLREPFVFQDYEYFTDAIRHPRLYIPFLGWWKFLGAVTGFVLAVAVGWWGESAPEQRWLWSGQLGALALMVTFGLALLWLGNRARLAVSFAPQQDRAAIGLLAFFWRYAQEGRRPLSVVSPFAASPVQPTGVVLPHLVAVQSESFFDPRALVSGIRPEVLGEFDRLKAEALQCGKLQVPAWGANTVRTEFAFLSGVAEARLGVHRFNPYRALAVGSSMPSLASYLKRLGYRTLCIHPYPASFYLRHLVFPRLGFDEFIDIQAFAGAERFGPYISDAEVAERIAALLAEAQKSSQTSDQISGQQPLFIFAITMENHGPLHMESVRPGDLDALYLQAPPDDCLDLSIYLRHLRNADRMMGRLRELLTQCQTPASLCWFGDHVPIMPAVYERFGPPSGEVDYLCWSNCAGPAGPVEVHIGAHELALAWLKTLGLVQNTDECPNKGKASADKAGRTLSSISLSRES
jgi:hypothetical protein